MTNDLKRLRRILGPIDMVGVDYVSPDDEASEDDPLDQAVELNDMAGRFLIESLGKLDVPVNLTLIDYETEKETGNVTGEERSSLMARAVEAEKRSIEALEEDLDRLGLCFGQGGNGR